MIPLIQKEIVGRGWLRDEDFPDIIALSQAAPGILAVNISIFVGYKLRGTRGSLVATLGSVLPSFLIILSIAALFTGFVIKFFTPRLRRPLESILTGSARKQEESL